MLDEAEGPMWSGPQQRTPVESARLQITGSAVAPRGTNRRVQGQIEALQARRIDPNSREMAVDWTRGPWASPIRTSRKC